MSVHSQDRTYGPHLLSQYPRKSGDPGKRTIYRISSKRTIGWTDYDDRPHECDRQVGGSIADLKVGTSGASS